MKKRKQARLQPHNITTLLNKPYPPPKRILAYLVTPDNRRLATIRVDESAFEGFAARMLGRGVTVVREAEEL